MRALSLARSILSCSVSIERMISQLVLGSSCVPRLERRPRIGISVSLAPTTPPATRSECPPMYLVSEYMTMSQPRRMGCCQTGPRKVLSTATGGRPPSWSATD